VTVRTRFVQVVITASFMATGLLIGSGLPSVSQTSEDLILCAQRQVGNLRVSTDLLPCSDRSERTITISTGGGSGAGGVSAFTVDLNGQMPTCRFPGQESSQPIGYKVEHPSLDGRAGAAPVVGPLDVHAGGASHWIQYISTDGDGCDGGHWYIFAGDAGRFSVMVGA
jgi:hypothetical protein